MLPKEERHLLLGRIDDLVKAGQKRRQHVHTEFLDMSEASTVFQHLETMKVHHSMEGGYEDAERKVAVIRSETSMEDFPGVLPIDYVRIIPASNKFLRVPNHRDYLGALMNLGIERRVIGDILIQEKGCVLICMSHITEYILTRLTHVGNCQVQLEQLYALTDEQTEKKYRTIRNTVASLRLDSIVKAAVNVSRGDSLSLIKSGRVFINGREVTKGSYDVAEGQVISVRGHGKFKVRTIGDRTKKDRISVEIDKYI